MHKKESTYARIYRVVQKIPKGKVATYGQIAKLSKCSGARQVGYALSALKSDKGIPWHRVVNIKGQISLPRECESHDIQRMLLESEGVEFGSHKNIELRRFQWHYKS